MALRLAFTRPGGGVTIINAAPKEDIENVLPLERKLVQVETDELGPHVRWMRPTLSQDQYIAFVMARSIPEGATDVTILPEDCELPVKDAYRNAWKIEAGKAVHDMPKARELHRTLMRAARKKLLEALDADYLRADEKSDDARKRQIVAQKEALRTVTDDPAIEAAATVDELKAVWPAALTSST
jgi:hypothetical protein